MRCLLLTILIAGAIAPGGAVHAQDVAVPQDNKSSPISSIFNLFSPHSSSSSTSSNTMAPAPQNAAKSAATNSITTPAPTPSPTVSVSSLNAALTRLYLPAQQQQSFIQTEQSNIQNLEKALNILSQTKGAYNTTPKTQQEKDNMAMMQQINAQTTSDIANQIQISQQRLQVLQSGPITITDFNKLYHP